MTDKLTPDKTTPDKTMYNKLTPQNGILNAPVYIPGSHTIDSMDTVAVLSANENPLGCSKNVIDTILKIPLNRYPDAGCNDLRKAIATLHDLNPNNIVCGAGSDEILQLLIHAYAGTGDEVLYPEHGFLIYPIATLTAGATPIKSAEKNYTVCVDSLLEEITDKTKIICIANPGNPTGTMLGRSEINRLIQNTPEHILIILDGAYAEYVESDDYTSGADAVKNNNNVVMTRTFSKVYGLASVRLGWAYASDDVAGVLNRVRGPFNVSSPAQSAGISAVADQQFVKNSQTHNTQQKKVLVKACEDLGLYVPTSFTNFILVKFTSSQLATQAYETLLSHGVIARLVGGYGLPNCVRITIGTVAENKQALNAMSKWQV